MLARSLKGQLSFDAFGARSHGYDAFVFGTLGSTDPNVPDTVEIELSKRRGSIDENHAWSLELPAGSERINRSRASVAVDARLGAWGRISFGLSGLPRRARTVCGRRGAAVVGPLKGVIRIETHRGFFRTLALRHLRGQVLDQRARSSPRTQP
jgi:hypothetical protein